LTDDNVLGRNGRDPRATDWSDDAIYLARREQLIDGLRKSEAPG
jgi:hypothetical protein